jgi:hypothetical protein
MDRVTVQILGFDYATLYFTEEAIEVIRDMKDIGPDFCIVAPGFMGAK